MSVIFRLDCSVIIFIILCVAFTSSLNDKYPSCTQKGPCACNFSNGTEINITNLSGYNFGWKKINDTLDILFNPCTDKPVDDNVKLNECYHGASICIRVNQTGYETKYINLGNSSDGKFLSPNSSEPISLHFSKNNSTTIVKFLCNDDKNAKPNLTASPESENNNYVLQLKSFQFCIVSSESGDHASGLSFGSGLVILFIVLTLVYFGGGMLTLKLLRGAEGKEMIPNYEFWADLPYLVRDGILFALNGCQQSPSYDRI